MPLSCSIGFLKRWKVLQRSSGRESPGKGSLIGENKQRRLVEYTEELATPTCRPVW